MEGVKHRLFMAVIAATEYLEPCRLLVTNYSYSSARMNPVQLVVSKYFGMDHPKVEQLTHAIKYFHKNN
jgi:hypothetical protein